MDNTSSEQDHNATPQEQIESFERRIKGWHEANSPGGWIDELRQRAKTAERESTQRLEALLAAQESLERAHKDNKKYEALLDLNLAAASENQNDSLREQLSAASRRCEQLEKALRGGT